MNNVIRFPSRRPEACAICEAWPRGRRERLLIEDISFGTFRRFSADARDGISTFKADLLGKPASRTVEIETNRTPTST